MKKAAHEIDRVVDELNDMDEDEAGMPKATIEQRQAQLLVAGPAQATDEECRCATLRDTSAEPSDPWIACPLGVKG
ncbi:MAG: hypothetical protein K0V04_39725 [Deltaproteobacteria bacterium]|nr:hypothetical protein [Deltaproteobacteria bacterium]